MKRIIRLYILTLCLVLPALILSACGKKTRPVPPQNLLPVSIFDLRYDLDENGALLTWSFSGQTASGKRFSEPLDFELFKAEVPAAKYCPDCPVQFGRPIHIDVNNQALDSSGKLTYRDSGLNAGSRYHYKIRPRLGRFSSAKESNVVSFWWQIPAAAPEDLQTDKGDTKVILNWHQPTRLIHNEQFSDSLVYQVYRSLDGKKFIPLAQPQKGITYTDATVQNNATYFYTVRAIRIYKDTKAHGAASQVVTATPKDMTPPSSPRHLTVVKTADGVKLLWDMTGDKDLGGYRIYRRAASSITNELVGNIPASQVIFIDRDLLSGSSCYYSVTAIDQEDPPNESPAISEIHYQSVR
jgi:hypothetical protein